MNYSIPDFLHIVLLTENMLLITLYSYIYNNKSYSIHLIVNTNT